MTNRSWLIGLSAGLLALVVTGCNRGGGGHARHVPFTEVSHEEKISPETTKLAVNNRVGDVQIVADAAQEVRIEAKVRISEDRASTTPKGGFEDHVSVTVAGDTLTVSDAHSRQPDREDWSMSITVHVPGRLGVQVTNGTGDVAIENTEADLALKVGVGGITARGETAEAVSVTVGTGDIALTIAKVSGKMAVETGVGGVSMKLRETVGEIDAHSGTGDVHLSVADSSPPKNVKLASGVGSLRLRIPSNAAGSFTLGAGVGSIHVKGHPGLQNTKTAGAGAKMQATVGEGGPGYNLHTGTGDIVLE